ncbi:DMT family transporter [Leptolyngbya sp. 15MV]|nr:DMT family transporter [Leptolyngbya sp. 15MV]
MKALSTSPPPPGGGQPPRPPTGAAFQITYRHIPGTSEVEVAAIGYDFDYTANGEPVSRRIVQRFNLAKRIQSAVLAPSKIMIGKNVLVEGDLGATFTDVTRQNGDPLVIRSDFMGLESGLDAELTKLFNAIRVSDVDRDNRLRVSHPTEGASIPSFANLPGFTHTTPEGLTVTGPDVTRDGYVDEFDVFIMYYDGRNGGVADGRIALHPAISAGTPHASLTPEFVLSGGVALDNGLGMLIDAANPDRNRNGEWRFLDRNGNGRFDPGVDELLDQEIVSAGSVPPELQNYVYTTGSGQQVVYRDQVLGFRDGVIDRKDQYSKVRGRLLFRTSSNAWTAAQGDFMERLRGPITPPVGSSAMQFAMGDQDLPEITAANFTNTRNALQQIASGATFEEQVAQNLGISVSQLATWTAANNSPDPTAPRLTPLAPDANRDGMPDNWQVAYFERMPFNSPSFVDWYYRPVYENMTFKNVQIPKGNNALFRNCTFVGVTWVRTNTNVLRTLAGFGGMFTAFYGYATLPLAEVTALGFTMPLFLIALSVLLLGERVGWRRWTAVVVGFCGVVLVARPGGGEPLPLMPVLLVLMSGFGWAIAMMSIRKLGEAGEHGVTIVMWFAINCSVLSLVATIPVWVTPDPRQWALLLAIGAVSAVAQLFMTEAYRRGETTLLAPFEYSGLLWTMALGALIWGEWPGGLDLLGFAVLVGAGLFIWWRETRVAR